MANKQTNTPRVIEYPGGLRPSSNAIEHAAWSANGRYLACFPAGGGAGGR